MRWLRSLFKPPRVGDVRLATAPAGALTNIVVGDRCVLVVRGEGTGTVAGVFVDGTFEVTVTVPLRGVEARVACRGLLPRRALRVAVSALPAPPAPPSPTPAITHTVALPTFCVQLEVPQ